MSEHPSNHDSDHGHSDHDDHDDHDDHGIGHVVGLKILIPTALALIVLTVITVLTGSVDFAEYDLPELNVWIAITIAGVKATLVCLFFMHLFWDRAFNLVILVSSVGFVCIMMGFAIVDTLEYKADIIPGDTPMVQTELQKLDALEPGDLDHAHDDHSDDEHAEGDTPE